MRAALHTLVVSDLHLGARDQRDVLRRAKWRAPLLDAVAERERLVLLGSEGPLRLDFLLDELKQPPILG